MHQGIRSNSKKSKNTNNNVHINPHKQTNKNKNVYVNSIENPKLSFHPNGSLICVPLNQVMQQKDLLKLSLFQSLKKVKGDFYLKTFYQKAKFVQVSQFYQENQQIQNYNNNNQKQININNSLKQSIKNKQIQQFNLQNLKLNNIKLKTQISATQNPTASKAKKCKTLKQQQQINQNNIKTAIFPSSQNILQLNQKKYFYYILSGQVNLYKEIITNLTDEKCQIKTWKDQENIYNKYKIGSEGNKRQNLSLNKNNRNSNKFNQIISKSSNFNYDQIKINNRNQNGRNRAVTSYSNQKNDKIKQNQKNSNKKSIVTNKCFLRSYISHQTFGYQQYPLYLQQKLKIQFPVASKLIIFPLQMLYKVFSNLISLVNIQMTAQFLKQISLFKQIQMQKLLRLSTFSKRIRTYQNQTILKQGSLIENIIIVHDGRVNISNQKKQFYQEQKNGYICGLKQIQLKKQNSFYQIKSIIQCQLIIIPLKQFWKISHLKHKLKDSILQDQKSFSKIKRKLGSNLSEYQSQNNNQQGNSKYYTNNSFTKHYNLNNNYGIENYSAQKRYSFKEYKSIQSQKFKSFKQRDSHFQFVRCKTTSFNENMNDQNNNQPNQLSQQVQMNLNINKDNNNLNISQIENFNGQNNLQKTPAKLRNSRNSILKSKNKDGFICFRPKTAFNTLGRINMNSKSLVYMENGRHCFLADQIDNNMNNNFFQTKYSNSSNKYRSNSLSVDHNSPNRKPSQTSSNDYKQDFLKKKAQKNNQTQKSQILTLGQLQYQKFLTRKFFLQQKQFSKLLKSHVPESIININKQYSVVKPFYQNKSSYIKNFKRKIKQANRQRHDNTKQKQINSQKKYFQNNFIIQNGNKINTSNIYKKNNQICQNELINTIQNKQNSNQKQVQFLIDQFIINQNQV